MKSRWMAANSMVVPGGRPSMIMCTWSGLKYWQSGGGKVTVPEPLSGSKQGLPTGGLTVILNWQVALPLQVSLATQVTVVVPTGKVLPEGGLQTTLTGGQPPLVVGGR